MAILRVSGSAERNKRLTKWRSATILFIRNHEGAAAETKIPGFFLPQAVDTARFHQTKVCENLATPGARSVCPSRRISARRPPATPAAGPCHDDSAL
jgi:hypothetical protein